jgi:LPXTG-site transpeptidase (sortase) family protein
MPHYRGGPRGRRGAGAALLLLGVLAVGLAGFYFALELGKPAESYQEPQPLVREAATATEPETPPPTEAETAPQSDTFYPVGEFPIDPALAEYEDGSMQLHIPKMGLTCGLNGDVAEETLLRGPGLFEFAQLPGPMERNANVSIAGTRDIGNSEFLLIDQLAEGDPMYLLYQDTLYTYEVVDSFVTSRQDDFDPMRVKEFPCITLQSCDPAWEDRATQDRIYVTGELVAVEAGAGFPE